MPAVRTFWLWFHAACTPPKMGYIHDGRKKKCERKSQVQGLHVLIALCSANERIYILWKCLIVNINQGLKASYRLKTGEKSGIQNSLSTNRAKLPDFFVPLLGK